MRISGSPDVLSGPISVKQRLGSIGSYWEQAWGAVGSDAIRSAIQNRFRLDIVPVLNVLFNFPGLSDGQRGTALQQIQNYLDLEYGEIGAFVGLTANDVFNVLNKADQPVRQGLNIIVQPTNTNVGLIFSPFAYNETGDYMIAIIPQGSDPVLTATPGGGGRGTNFQATTTTGVVATAMFEPLPYTPVIPFNSAVYGAIVSIWKSSNISTRQKVKAIWDIVFPYNTTISELANIFHEDEISLTNIFNMRFADDSTAQPINEAVVAAPSFNADAALNSEFAIVFNDTSLTMDEKAARWQKLMRDNGLYIEDASRITGIDVNTIANFLAFTATAQAALHPVVVAAPLETIIMIDSPSYQYATAANGIGIDAFYNNILTFLDTGPTTGQVEAAKSEWGVSDTDIQNALLYRQNHPVIVAAVEQIDAQVQSGETPTTTMQQKIIANDSIYTELPLETVSFDTNTSPSYQYATDANGIGLDAFYNNILTFLDTGPTAGQVEAAKSEWGVSDTDIQNALLYRQKTTMQQRIIAEDSFYPEFPLETVSFDYNPQAVTVYTENTSNYDGLNYLSPMPTISNDSIYTELPKKEAQSPAFKAATSEGGIGIEAMNQNITNYLATNPTIQEVVKSAKDWGVSVEDIARVAPEIAKQVQAESAKIPVAVWAALAFALFRR